MAQTACASGTPFVGIGLQPERASSIDLVARYGSALSISKRRLNRVRLQADIGKVLADETMRQKARQLQQVMRSWDGSANVASFRRSRFL